MKDYINPYYEPDKLDLELLSFDEPNLSYEYNTLCFWATKDGRIYSASDSGCSCPTPFENYTGQTLDAVLQQLERVGTISQAESIFNSWNAGYGDIPYLSISNRDELITWISGRIFS